MNTLSAPKTSLGFPSLLQDFFCQRLIGQRNVTARTVAAYRDSFRLLLRYTESRLRRSPVAITLDDLDAPLILGFLDYLEHERGNCVRSRNLRLVAIRSFLRYAAYRDPTALPTIQRVLAIPMKRFDRPLLGYLSCEEMQAILEAPDRTTWSGQRDHVMLTVFYNTGARVSEVITLRVCDLDLGHGASVRIRGKGRKQRSTRAQSETTFRYRVALTRRPPPQFSFGGSSRLSQRLEPQSRIRGCWAKHCGSRRCKLSEKPGRRQATSPLGTGHDV